MLYLRTSGWLLSAVLILGVQVQAVELSRDGAARLGVVHGEMASESCKASARELSRVLGRISGADFDTQAGDGSRGIVVGVINDFPRVPFEVAFDAGRFHREDYLIRSTDTGLYLLGATELAVSNAVWDLLYRLGHRQFFPGEIWEHVPRQAHLQIDLDVVESPDFYSRRIWYNWAPGWGLNTKAYDQWCRRNRMQQGFTLVSNHSYAAIRSQSREAFEAHPEYIALVDGKRESNKFCTSNPGLQELIRAYVLRHVKENRDVDSLSLEPSDYGGWCECGPCGEMGSESDRALFLANIGGRALREMGLGHKYVGMYAYYYHAPPPTIAVDPNVIVSVANGLIRGPFSFNQIVAGWKKQQAQVGMYDYFSVVGWDRNLPGEGKASNPAKLAANIVEYHRLGARFLDCESGDSWGVHGPGYYVASRVMWDVSEAQRVDALMQEFLVSCFGQAQEPMTTFYRMLQEKKRQSSADLVGGLYRLLQNARRLESDPAVHRRVEALILYVRYVELYHAYQQARSPAEKELAEETLYRYMHQIRSASMVHSYGLWSRRFTREKAVGPHAWHSQTALTRADIAGLLAKGIAANPLTEAVPPVRTFGTTLIPARVLGLPSKTDGYYPKEAQSHQRYHVWLGEKEGLRVSVNCKRVWNNHPHGIQLMHEGREVDRWNGVKPDSQDYTVQLKSDSGGLHQLNLRDGADHSRITWPALPVVVETGLDSPGIDFHFRGMWSLYVYVPKGTKAVCGWSSRVANWAPRQSGVLRNADGIIVLDFGKEKDGWFRVPVTKGQDGRVWKFEDSIGKRLLTSVPPYLAVSPDLLLLPTEVVKADAALSD